MKQEEIKKEPFTYQYTKPTYDWYDTVNVKINPNDYYYFRLERRFGPCWWLIGLNPKDEPNYHWEEKQIGEIGNADLLRFIEWAEFNPFNTKGSRIIEIKMISGEFDIFKEIAKIIKGVE